jgi:DNA-binding Lrp family transcriptional regulator
MLPNTIATFHMAGINDFLIHVAAKDAEALRDYVLDHITTHPAVLHTETNLIFGTIRGVGVLTPQDRPPKSLIAVHESTVRK